MRRWLKVLVVLAIVLAMPAGFAWAGFIKGSIGVELANQAGHGGPPPWAGPPEFVFDLMPDASGNGQLKLNENFGGPETLGHVIGGITDQDPVMNIVKDINNDSGFEWLGFALELPDQNGITFTGTPTSSHFTVVAQDDYHILFGAPGTVPVGQTMTLDFDVLVPSTGPFSFTLTQTPLDFPPSGIPEPSVFVLLAMGGLAMAIRRRRS